MAQPTEWAVLVATIVSIALIVLRVMGVLEWGGFVLALLATMVIGTAVDHLEKRRALRR